MLVEALIVVEGAELHTGHFSHVQAPARRSATWLASRTFGVCRTTSGTGALGRAVIDNDNVDGTLARLMELVLDAVEEDR